MQLYFARCVLIDEAAFALQIETSMNDVSLRIAWRRS